jgi:hypothetical protein
MQGLVLVKKLCNEAFKASSHCFDAFGIQLANRYTNTFYCTVGIKEYEW